MEILLYLAGLIIGITAFIYVFSLIAEGSEKLKKAGSAKPCQPGQDIDSGTVAFRNRPALPPGTRICPLCRSSLTRYEGLYASKVEEKGNPKLVIMGCRYCYKENEDPAKPKRSMI